jgi:hypothetical protein
MYKGGDAPRRVEFAARQLLVRDRIGGVIDTWRRVEDFGVLQVVTDCC